MGLEGIGRRKEKWEIINKTDQELKAGSFLATGTIFLQRHYPCIMLGDSNRTGRPSMLKNI